MPQPILILVLLLSIPFIAAIVAETYKGNLKDNGAIMIIFIIYILGLSWLVAGTCQDLSYYQQTEAVVQTETFQGQTNYYITYLDNNDVKRSMPIGCVKPGAKVFVREPVREYCGLYFFDLKPKIEVIDVKVQSSEQQVEKISQGEVSEGLLGE